jgi:hypothetical protein
VGVEDAGQRHPAVGQLLHQAGVGHGVEGQPAVLLGDLGPEQPEGLHLLEQPVGEAVGVLEVGGDRDHLLAHPFAHGGNELVGDGNVVLRHHAVVLANVRR